MCFGNTPTPNPSPLILNPQTPQLDTNQLQLNNRRREAISSLRLSENNPYNNYMVTSTRIND